MAVQFLHAVQKSVLTISPSMFSPFKAVKANLNVTTKVLTALGLVTVLSACSGGSSGSPDTNQTTTPVPAVDINANRNIVSINDSFVYRQDSPYKLFLKECALANDTRDSCLVSTLPLIGDGSAEVPTIDQIMDRLVVSHDWMGPRFEQVLESATPEMLQMFSSLTAIVVASDIRPSHYRRTTGAIYLDANQFWLTTEEKLAVTLEEDYRASFGSELQFSIRGPAVKDNDFAVPFFSLDDVEPRTFEEMLLPLKELLYHELAHAVDFSPFNTLSSFNLSDMSIFDTINFFEDDRLSNRLIAALPLVSDEMEGLARVRWSGADASDDQKSALPDYVSGLVANDGASRFYSYFTLREDLANLVTATMMAYEFGITEAIAVTNIFTDPENQFCNDLIVSWGQNNRLADPLVLPRAKLTIEMMFGSDSPVLAYLENDLPPVNQMTPGVGYCDNIRGNTSALAADLRVRQDRGPSLLELAQRERQLNHDR